MTLSRTAAKAPPAMARTAVSGVSEPNMPPAAGADAALAQCPREAKLVSLSGEETVLSAGGPSVFWTGNAVNMAQDKTVVPIDSERFVDMVHVVDGLEHVHAMVSTCLADVPANVRGMTGLRLIAENCLKHIRPCIYHPRETKGMIEMAQVLLDGKPLAESPIISISMAFGESVFSFFLIQIETEFCRIIFKLKNIPFIG